MKVGYMRVSSENDRQSTLMQKDALMRAGVDERNIYEDKISASKQNRPGLEQALKFLRQGDELVVWKLDRLARSTAQLIEIANDLKTREIMLISLTEQLDTTSPYGNLFFQMMGALAEFELALTRERIMEGLSAAKKRGSKFGRPCSISDEKMEVIIESIRSGKSKAAICRTFDVKKATLFNAINRYQDKHGVIS